jgi:hypothetical protein
MGFQANLLNKKNRRRKATVDQINNPGSGLTNGFNANNMYLMLF